MISTATIRRHLMELKITLKRTSLILDRVNDQNRLEQRRDFATFFLTNCSVDDRNNVFIDESGFNLHMRRNYGRSSSGKRATIIVPTIRGKNITLLSALNSEGIIHYQTFTGSCNSEIFSDFIKELDKIMVETHNITKGYIFMDNARPHTSRASAAVMATLTNSTKFLSPYSYMINPIEFSFSKVKFCIRKWLGEMSADLNHLIPCAISEITGEDCLGWYRLIRRNCALAMQMHHFQ